MVRVGLWTLIAAVGIGLADEETARVIAWGAVSVILLGVAFRVVRNIGKPGK
jgi:hypothetical protein